MRSFPERNKISWKENFAYLAVIRSSAERNGGEQGGDHPQALFAMERSGIANNSFLYDFCVYIVT